ncbi:MAG: hypothetical protein Aureis2KO_07090 [Aureisphaera sp.]
MAPIKFEENIREKLQDREIQPSDGAWEKLEGQLGALPNQKRPAYFWMAVAASFVGVLLIGSWLFFGTDSSTEQLVEDNSDKVQEETPYIEDKREEIVAPLNDNSEEELAVSEEIPEDSSESIIPSEENVNTESDKKAIASIEITQQKVEKKVVENTALDAKMNETMAFKDIEEEEKAQVVTNSGEEAFIQQKVDQVIEEVKKIQELNSTVSAEEIDALLAKAQRDIATKRILDSSHQKVDAQALLMDVEVELERSFRDRVFDALGEGFSKVRTAVAERNN